ncbi:hypothetical protein [Paracidovorax avenae]|uniref:hypothetical protein n=1 Tax=Paracidovorax avenae TaxID=80867 RepID=UPI000D22752B|nr:hypothetical protein [Paracidovorax avenae]AVT12143.1 hypothetical protein C8235_04085 [Paracidovorax avenae]
MKIHPITFTAIAAMAFGNALAAGRPTQEFWRAQPLRQVTIDQPAARSFGQSQCSHLVLDEKRLRFFLEHARAAAPERYDQEMLVDDCNAEGRVELKDGRRFKVSIDNWTGWGSISDDRSTQFLYCRSCTDILEPGFGFQPAGRRGSSRRN